MNLKLRIEAFPEFMFKVGLALMAFLTPLQPVLLAITILIIADCISGVWASKVRGIVFSSTKFFSSISKLLVYLMLIIVSKLVEVYLVPVIPFVQLSCYFIVFYEFSSLLENIGIITGRDAFKFFRDALNKLKPTSNKE